MSCFEEEALTRAQQMHRRTPYYKEAAAKNYTTGEISRKQEPAQSEKPHSVSLEEKSEKNFEKNTLKTSKKQDNLLDIMFKNKEQSLILLLIVLLMEENSDPSVLLALVYLLL